MVQFFLIKEVCTTGMRFCGTNFSGPTMVGKARISIKSTRFTKLSPKTQATFTQAFFPKCPDTRIKSFIWLICLMKAALAVEQGRIPDKKRICEFFATSSGPLYTMHFSRKSAPLCQRPLLRRGPFNGPRPLN